MLVLGKKTPFVIMPVCK